MSLITETLSKYLRNNFIETGSSNGDGIQLAIDCGFKNIFSIEINEERYFFCKNRFKDNKNVNLYLGDSLDKLIDILLKISEPSTFWLDAHPCSRKEMYGKIVCPVLIEIELILKNNLKHHILIDDKRLFVRSKNLVGKVSYANILDKFKELNTNSHTKLENGTWRKDIISYTGQ